MAFRSTLLFTCIFLVSTALALRPELDLSVVAITLNATQPEGNCQSQCSVAVPYLEACFSGNTTGCLGICNTTTTFPPLALTSGCFSCLATAEYHVVATETLYDNLNGVMIQLKEMCTAFGASVDFDPGLFPFTQGIQDPPTTVVTEGASTITSTLPFLITTITSGLLVEVTSAVAQHPAITSGTKTFVFSQVAVSPTAVSKASQLRTSFGMAGMAGLVAVAKETSAEDYAPSDPQSRVETAEFWGKPRSRGPLSNYRILSPTAGVRVSPLCLGAMSLGDQWTGYMAGKLDVKESEEYLDFFLFIPRFLSVGGNFIDTAPVYQNEQSEKIIGDWMEKRGNRDDMVIATKYTTYYKRRAGEDEYPGVSINYGGNSRKTMMTSVEESLKNLKTSYIDILYIHWWNHSSSVAEVMQGLGDLVRQGKVNYIAVSDSPAWVVSQANEYARQNALPQFVTYQGAYNLGMRDMERDILPMCRNNGMSICPYATLGQGRFKSPEELKNRSTHRAGMAPSEAQIKLCEELQEVADEIGGGTKLVSVALAWARQQHIACIPIVGGTKIAYLKDNIEALNITLTQAQLDKLDKASPFEHGFPTGRFGVDPRLLEGRISNNPVVNAAGVTVYNGWPAE